MDDAGEMRVGAYAHDYLEELDWSAKSPVVFRSLYESTKHVARRVADHQAYIAEAIEAANKQAAKAKVARTTAAKKR